MLDLKQIYNDDQSDYKDKKKYEIIYSSESLPLDPQDYWKNNYYCGKL